MGSGIAALCKGDIWDLNYLGLGKEKMCPVNSFIDIILMLHSYKLCLGI